VAKNNKQTIACNIMLEKIAGSTMLFFLTLFKQFNNIINKQSFDVNI
jgi:hypothetical protein